MRLIAAVSQHPPIHHMTMIQAIVLGIIQGIFELFPLSSLGHTVLIPSWLGGDWATLVRQESQPESPYLAFIVGLHLANALVLLAFYIREWSAMVAGFFRSIARRRIETDTERLAWLVVVATIPVGVLGLALEHVFRTLFAKPVAAAAFLVVNGLILAAGEWFRRHPVVPAAPVAAAPAGQATAEPADPVAAAPATQETVVPAAPGAAAPATQERAVPAAVPPDPATPAVAAAGGSSPPPRPVAGRFSRLRDEHFVSLGRDAEGDMVRQISFWSALWIGAAQSLALLAGISREGVAMVGGLYRGLSNENALRFAFLLSTPVILAAGVYKVPDLLGPLGNGIRGQVLAGSAAAVIASLVAIVFLLRWFKTRTLVPFAVYSLGFGLVSLIRFAAF